MRRITRQWLRVARLNISSPLLKVLQASKKQGSLRSLRFLNNLQNQQSRLYEKIRRFNPVITANLTPNHSYTSGYYGPLQTKETWDNDFRGLRNIIDRGKDSLHYVQDNTDSIKDALKEKRQELKDELLTQRDVLRRATAEASEQLELRRSKLRSALQQRKESINTRVTERSRVIIEDLKNTKNLVKERIEKENIYTIPNLLCVTRIAFSPYLGYLIVTGNFEYALAFMTVAGFSDWLDGWIARTYPSQSSKIGSFLDPMADKVLIGTLFVTLSYVDLIPVALTGLIIARDVALVVAGFVIRYQSLPPPRTLTTYFDATHATAQLAPTMISKVNTGVQLMLVATTLAAPVFGYVGHPTLNALCYVTATTTVLAALSYITRKDTYRYIRRKK